MNPQQITITNTKKQFIIDFFYGEIDRAKNEKEIENTIRKFRDQFLNKVDCPTTSMILMALELRQSKNRSTAQAVFLRLFIENDIPFKTKKKTIDFESQLNLYSEMIDVSPSYVVEFLCKNFINIGLVETLKNEVDSNRPQFNIFFDKCKKIALLHPKIATCLIEYLTSKFRKDKLSIHTLFTSDELLRLYEMLHKFSSQKSDLVFANQMKHLFNIFGPEDREDFEKFLKKSAFICALGPCSTKAFLKNILCTNIFNLSKNFTQILRFYEMILQFGDEWSKNLLIKKCNNLSFSLIFLGADHSDQEMILAEPFLERVEQVCAIDSGLVDAFANWICNLRLEHLSFEKKHRLQLCERLLMHGSSKTLKLLMTPSDPLQFQKDVLDSNEKELASLDKQCTLNAQKALFILSCRKQLKNEEDPHQRRILTEWIGHIEKWCLLSDVVLPMEEDKTPKEQAILAKELRCFLPLIFSYRNPRLRIKLSDAFFETKELLFSRSKKKSLKLRRVEDFSRLLLSNCVENELSLEIAQNLFNQILENNNIFKDTQALTPLIDFLDILGKKLPFELQDLAGQALLKALSSKTQAIEDIKSLNGMLLLFDVVEYEQALSDYCLGASPNQIFQKIFTDLFSVSSVKNIQQRYEMTFGTFRNPRAIFLYAASLKKLDTKIQVLARKSLKTYVKAVLTDNFPAIRCNPEHNLHLRHIFQKRPDLKALWAKTTSFREIIVIKEPCSRNVNLFQRTLRIGLTQDAQDLLLIGTEVKTCLAVNEHPYHNKGLGGCLVGDALFVAVKTKEHPKIIARTTLRVLWCSKKEQAVLLIEKIYKKHNDKIIDYAIKEEVIAIAKKFNLPLLTTHVDFDEMAPYEGNVMFMGGLEAYIYSDTAENIFDGRDAIPFNNLFEVILK